MDIGVPYRDLGRIDVTAAVHHVQSLPDESWKENTFRQDVLADSLHSDTSSIVFKHEWRRWDNPWGLNTLEELIHKWGSQKGIDPNPLMRRS